MERLAKNLIFAALIGSAVCVAGLSSAHDCRENYPEYTTQTVTENKSGDKDSEFWSKFRESVMPDDSDKGKVPNYEQPPPDEEQRPSRNRAM